MARGWELLRSLVVNELKCDLGTNIKALGGRLVKTRLAFELKSSGEASFTSSRNNNDEKTSAGHLQRFSNFYLKSDLIMKGGWG